MNRPNRNTLFIIAMASSLLATAAQAGDRPRIVVVPFIATEGATDSAAVKFSVLVSDELKSHADLEVVAPPRVGALPAATAAPGAGAQRTKPSPEAIAAMDAGRKAFDDLRFEDAVRELRRGLDGMLSEPGTADYDNVQDGFMKLAAAMFRLGQEKEARNVLVDLSRFNEKFELPPGYPPVFQRELEKAKKRLDKQPRGQLVVEGPPGATAFIDGRDLGMVPVTEENLPGGLHYVKVEGAKGERFGQIVEVKGGSVKVKGAFGAPAEAKTPPVQAVASDPRVGPTVDDGMRERLTAYAKTVNAEWVVFGVVYRVAETQLTSGLALLSVKKGVVALAPQTFDTDVLTANTEAFKVGEEITKKLSSFSAVSLPLALVTKKTTGTTVAVVKPKETKSGDTDVEAATPKNRGALFPKDDTRVLATKSTVIDVQPPKEGGGEEPPAVKSGGIPVWVWVVTGVVVVTAASVGGYLGYTEANKPVTGTVTATW